MQADSKGFGIRLGRAIDRWPGGGQRAFAEELKRLTRRKKVRVPTSYRTLANYLSEDTTPSEAWVNVAAELLRADPDYLRTGLRPQSEDPSAGLGWSVTVTPEAASQTQALVHLVINENLDLPMAAREMMHRFATYYYADDFDAWEDWAEHGSRRELEVRALVQRYYGPLLGAPRMGELELMALAASLTAAAYLTLTVT